MTRLTIKLRSLIDWIDQRTPMSDTWRANSNLGSYYAPKNSNLWSFMGTLALISIGILFFSGIFLSMHYKPDASLNEAGIPRAFASVEYIMRDVPWGWFIRYLHAVSGSVLLLLVYLHMFRSIIKSSYSKPRELTWLLGICIFFALVLQTLFGYLLPWGQLSYWAAQVIVNTLDQVPFLGRDFSDWVRGDYVLSDATLNRFYAFHVVAIPLLLVYLLIKHVKYTVRDLRYFLGFFTVCAAIVFFVPEGGGYLIEYNNFTPADPMTTPEHIAPLWYFTAFYSILRCITYPLFGIDAKFWGVMGMMGSMAIFALLPWLDRSRGERTRKKGPVFKTALALFIIAFIVLTYLGMLPTTPIRLVVAQICTAIYFGFFLLMPLYSRLDSLPIQKGDESR